MMGLSHEGAVSARPAAALSRGSSPQGRKAREFGLLRGDLGFGAVVVLVALGALGACDASPEEDGTDDPDRPLCERVAREERLLVGAAVFMDPLETEAEYRDVLAREFDYITPEHVMKWGVIEPAEGEFDFEPADRFMDFAEAHGQEVKGHTLVWQYALPDWVKAIDDPAKMRSVLVRHVHTVAEHFRGRVYAWDVVNEAASGLTGEYENHVFYRLLGPEYVTLAFQTAREADPDAVLIYNDWGTELVGPKFDFVLDLARDLHEIGLCDEIGFQMHLPLSSLTTLDQVRANFSRVAEAGLRLNISELDVGIKSEAGDTDDERRASQAERYHDLVAACVEVAACEAVTFWGFTDKYTWIDKATFPGAGPGNEPLLFDETYERKPTWWAVARALEGR